MKNNFFLLLLFSALLVVSCSKDDVDDVIPTPPPQGNNGDTDLGVHNFVYSGLNIFYLYKDEIEELATDYFTNDEDYTAYLSEFDTPEDLFESLLSPKDRFSILVPNFRELEKELSGITKNHGMDYGLGRFTGSDGVFGYVRYVLPNTSAEEEGVERGMLFYEIDGEEMNLDNYSQLLRKDSYTISLAEIQLINGQSTVVPLNKTATLTKVEYTEDPIYLHKVIDVGGQKIGYLMYNAYTSSFDSDLNDVFGEFKAEGVSDLVLDLRYNGGGSVNSSVYLAGMITGQFTDQLFAQEVYNSNFDDDELYFQNKTSRGVALNSLNLSKVYILTTGSTASASELTINGLKPYIDVVQIGETTVGKFQGSITVYDSEDFSRSAVKPGHDYAMQPLIMKLANADGVSDYVDGLAPTIEMIENLANMGVLGEESEPYLARALEEITGTDFAYYKKRSVSDRTPNFIQVGERKMNQLDYQRMYKENMD